MVFSFQINISETIRKHFKNKSEVLSTHQIQGGEAIKEAKEEIAALESGKKKITQVCPECGTKTSIDMKYCGACGTCLQEA